MTATLFTSQIQNVNFTNLSSVIFDVYETYVLGMGLGFIPSMRPASRAEVQTDFDVFERRVMCHDFFWDAKAKPPDETPPSTKFHVPNPGWHPEQVDGWESTPGVKEYVCDVRSKIMNCVDDSVRLHAAHPIHNLSRRHRDALRRLLLRRDIVILDADKNLGLVVLDAADYQARCIDELGKTHHLLQPGDEDPHASTQTELTELLEQHGGDLPQWAQKFLAASIDRHPRTGEEYSVPNFRVTIKVHKDPPEGRPLTANQIWRTQPAAELIAELCKPYVEGIPVWTKDSDSINRKLSTLKIPENALLLTYDIVRLYPSIPHALCYTLLRSFLRERGCKYADFIVNALRIILNRNYCCFNGETFRQHIGFATGISCGAEIANIFIFVLTRHVFARFGEYILNHDRYIDDGFIVWTGTALMAGTMFAQLNALDSNIGLTHTVSLIAAVFLDIYISKGQLFKTRRLLDTKTYQKPMNRYLMLPFCSEHTTNCKLSVVHGELRRYIKRSSARNDYVQIAGMLRQRLHLRGFPFWFLTKAFATAPRYETRDQLLALKPKTDDNPVIVFSTTYSNALLKSGLSRAIFSNQKYLVHRKWDNVKFINAWRAGRKLGGSLIAYKFPKPARRPDSAPSTVLQDNTDFSVIDVPLDTNSSTVSCSLPTSNAAASNSTYGAPQTDSPSNSDDQACNLAPPSRWALREPKS